jgi:hypothetical protein
MMPGWDQIVQDPTTHPYYNEYKEKCLRANLPLKFTADSWRYMIQGLERQAEFKRQQALNAQNPELIAFSDLIKQNRDVLMKPPNLGANTKMALWSGGIAVSEHVRKLGYETLESTLYGGILDKMTTPKFKIWLGDKTWGPQGKIWNVISAEYVNVVAKIRNTMHVFMRTHDLDSVFYREELVNWQKAKGKKPEDEDGLTYHILIGMDTFEVEKIFYSEKNAKRYLLSFLGLFNKEFSESTILKKGTNYRFRSEVWRDNGRALQATFAKKTYESYKAYIENPLPSIIRDYALYKEQIAPSDETTKNFSAVMKELLQVRKRVD